MPRLFMNQIADYLVGLIQNGLTQMRSVTKADLSVLTAADLPSLAPGVIVEPRQVYLSPVNAGHSFENDYYFRVYYFRQSVAGQGAKGSLIAETEPLLELILEHFQMPGFELENCMGAHVYPSVVEYAVMNDKVLQKMQDLQIDIVPVDVEVHSHSRR